MSHFLVMVIGSDPEEQLSKYNENIEMEPYISGPVSEEDKDSMTSYYKEKYSENENKDFEELYSIYGEDWNDKRWKKNKEGIWENWSIYNPLSKWDWYELGGRWSGEIKLKEGAKGVEGRPGVFNNEVGIDQAQKGDIINLNELGCHAIVKNGEWYESGKMGWWGIVIDEMDENVWKEQIVKHLEDLPDDTLISMYDCHI